MPQSVGKRGVCPGCDQPDRLLHQIEWNDPDEGIACAECIRERAKTIRRVQMCDNDPEHGPAWRNPYTRRNEYLCGNCHAKSGDGVVQNKWAGDSL